jgi:hypothetical protein
VNAPPLWTCDYTIAGYSGTVTGIDVAWVIRASIYDAAESTQSATVRVLIDDDLRFALRRNRMDPGFASLTQGTVVRMQGRIRDVEWEPVDGGRRTLVTFTLRDSEIDDNGTFPSPQGWKPDRRPDDVVGYETRLVERGSYLPEFVEFPVFRGEEYGDLPAPSDGAFWPYVFGAPGAGTDGTTATTYPAAPAYIANEDGVLADVNNGLPIFLISAGIVEADTVSIWGPAVGNASVEITIDPDTGGPDWVKIYTTTLSASAAPGAGLFVVVGGDTDATAVNLVNAINDPTNGLDDICEARIDPINASRVLIRRYIPVDADGNDRFGYQVKITVNELVPGTFVITPEDGTLVGQLETSIYDVDHGFVVQHGEANGFAFAWVDAARTTGWRQNIAWIPQQRYYASWTSRARSGGAGDVLLDVLSASTVRIDVSEFLRLRQILNGYTLGGYVDTPVVPTQFVRAQLLPLLPIDLVPGPNGLRPVLQAGTTADDGDTGIAIRAGNGIARASPARIAEIEQVAGVIVEYGRREDTGKYSQSAKATKEETPHSALAFVATGIEDLQSDYVHDAATARRIAADRVLRRSVAGHGVRYVVADWNHYGPGGACELYAGRRVRLTDDDLGFEDVPGVVSEVETDAQSMLVTIETIETPLEG